MVKPVTLFNGNFVQNGDVSKQHDVIDIPVTSSREPKNANHESERSPRRKAFPERRHQRSPSESDALKQLLDEKGTVFFSTESKSAQ